MKYGWKARTARRLGIASSYVDRIISDDPPMIGDEIIQRAIDRAGVPKEYFTNDDYQLVPKLPGRLLDLREASLVELTARYFVWGSVGARRSAREHILELQLPKQREGDDAYFMEASRADAVVLFVLVERVSGPEACCPVEDADDLAKAWLKAWGIEADVEIIPLDPEFYDPPDHPETRCSRCGGLCPERVCCAAATDHGRQWATHEEPVCDACCSCPSVLLAGLPGTEEAFAIAKTANGAELVINVVVAPSDIAAKSREAYRARRDLEARGVQAEIEIRVTRAEAPCAP